MDYFFSLISKKNEFCVDHSKLQEYGVLTNIDTSKDIKRRLETLMLIENEDYLLGNVAQSVKQGGFSNKKEYKLTPKAFKLCLIRAKNSKVYANYYLMLEEIFYYYREYQNQYQLVL
jgi:phage anti-repressor protein